MRRVTREQAIDEVRREVLDLVGDGEHSMCAVAAQAGLFCKGFRRLSDDELQDRYRWLIARRGPVDREELEELADRWQLARQLVNDQQLACDVQTMENDTCPGWKGFGDRELERFVRELTGEKVEIAAS